MSRLTDMMNFAADAAYKRGYKAGLAAGAPKWKSAKDEPPTEDCKALCCYHFDGSKHRFYSVLYYNATDEIPHFQHELGTGMKVTHWMPLPEPPKENTDE